jgi:hypothetical protein
MSQKISVFGKIALRNSKLKQQPNLVINWKKTEKHTKATLLFVFSQKRQQICLFQKLQVGRGAHPTSNPVDTGLLLRK